MSHQEFIELVSKMRSLQKAYFRTRDREILTQSKAAEAAVDREIREMTSPHKQTSLF